MSPAERDRVTGKVACRVRAAELLLADALTAETIEPALATRGGWALLVAAAGSSTFWPPTACEGGVRDDRT